MILFVDTETYCEVPIRNGTHAYAEQAEIIIETWAVDDGPVQIADRTAGELGPWALYDPEDFETIVFHKSDFDRTVYRHCDRLAIPVELIHDTMVQAQSHGLPGGLDKLCDIFQIPVDKAKDKAGKQLIQLFCKPRPASSKLHRATRHTHPVEWERFKEYAKLDISAMRAIYKKMPRWNYPAPREHALWCLDQRMNDRGLAMDLDLARAAIQTVADAKKIMDARTQEITEEELRSTTQRDQLLKFVLKEYGVELPDMTATTLERRLEDPHLPDGAHELIRLRLQTSTTSNAKYNRLLKAVSADGRLRGSIQFTGAARTKRWSGKIFQPQNLPRPDMKAEDIELGIECMKARSAHLLYDHPIKLASNAIRGVIVASEGKKLVVSDLEQIEARVLPWLAGEQWKLDDFTAADSGEEEYDLYTRTAARVLGKQPCDVTKEERQAYGKVSELSCGYGGSLGAYSAMGEVYGFRLPDAQVMDIIRGWRAKHPAICDWDTGLWKKLDDAARLAIMNPGQVYDAGEFIRFERWRNWLKMHLPSGGFLSYAMPAMAEDPRRPGSMAISYMGLNNYTRRWERLYTYGGKLSADATQSTAREIMAGNLPAIEAAGYDPVLLVHDEVVTETLDSSNFSVHELNGLLAAQPSWAPGLPLAAGGFEAYRYRKDG